MAYGQNIYVYVPQFPEQRISEQPVLIFTSQQSATHLTGYIDQRTPHAVNNLIIQLLGNEEVVAVVRDDGDVDAFLVRHVVQAIERREARDSSIGINGDEIKPFFQSNVGSSAWGLAIHSEARILATSSNAHEVRVFKFGLLQTEDDEATSDDDKVLPDSETTGNDEATDRRTDVTHHVLNGETNIPYIAFCNTGDDPSARWLLTTDISGVCRVMDLHALRPVQRFRFGRSFATGHMGGFDRLNAGWAIMFLDRKSFQQEDEVYVALGVDEVAGNALPKLQQNGDIWDLSHTVRRFKESLEPFVYSPIQTRANDQRSSRQGPRDDHDGISSSSPPPLDDGPEGAESSDGGASVDIEIEMSEDTHEEEDDGGIEVESTDPIQEERGEGEDEIQDQVQQEDDNMDETMSSSSTASTSEPDNYLESDLVDDGEDPDDEGTEDTISFTSFYNGESIVGNGPRFVPPSASLCEDLPCPILHASVRNVYLLQPSSKQLEQDSAFVPPMVGLANPLRQTIHQQIEYLRIFERLNMNAYIQSLGIVVLASQKGRALVLSLTKLTRTAHYPKEMQRQLQDRHKSKTNFCMRVECILPFEHQEKANQRSCYPLHGIAVGPLQGSEDVKPESRRWRLMMTYQDHSILSYEIGRKPKRTRDSGVDVASLVI